ncbi:uncharacterized protein LOC142624859 [Castanea sativa]|uniref:uncharacterized protein LOC142624859 n=1 Tax=Castanea sativa TaxID=21020 RepID=UPI003F6532DD
MDLMMDAFRGQVSSDLDELVYRMDSPLTTPVTSFPFPPKFSMSQVESYDGSKDPLDHLETFKTLMHLQGVANEIMCKAFLTTLRGPIRVWYKKSTACLMNIKQREDEMLRSYITCFNKEALSIDEVDDKILVAAFTNGLQKRKFLFYLYKNDPKKCKLKGDSNKRSRDKYYHFHRDHGHDTFECYNLKQHIEALIRQGKLQRFISKEKTDQLQEQGPRRENERLKPPIGDIRMIVGGTTTSSSTKKARKTYLWMVQNVQLTGLVPKMVLIDNPIIGFSEEDARRLHHPHDDALVMSIWIDDYNTHKVLVDNGSSADILYYPTF